MNMTFVSALSARLLQAAAFPDTIIARTIPERGMLEWTSGVLQIVVLILGIGVLIATILLIGAVSLWTPFLNDAFRQKWFVWPQLLYAAPVPALLGVCVLALWQGLDAKSDRQPFFATLGLFVLSFAGLCVNFYPYIVPSSVTIYEAAAPDNSLSFLLVGSVVLLPLILADRKSTRLNSSHT